ncbi:MAG: hypothetical protein WCQ95_09145 [Bacteroidota bacterium]
MISSYIFLMNVVDAPKARIQGRVVNEMVSNIFISILLAGETRVEENATSTNVVATKVIVDTTSILVVAFIT